MNEMVRIGLDIKRKRLSLNLRMDDVAKKAGITRATLSAIEKGESNCSLSSLINVSRVLGLTIGFGEPRQNSVRRNRASRINTKEDKKINAFIIMCIEQYASNINTNSVDLYKEMSKKGLIKELIDDYEDLHGMSIVWLIDYIDSLLKGAKK